MSKGNPGVVYIAGSITEDAEEIEHARKQIEDANGLALVTEMSPNIYTDSTSVSQEEIALVTREWRKIDLAEIVVCLFHDREPTRAEATILAHCAVHEKPVTFLGIKDGGAWLKRHKDLLAVFFAAMGEGRLAKQVQAANADKSVKAAASQVPDAQINMSTVRPTGATTKVDPAQWLNKPTPEPKPGKHQWVFFSIFGVQDPGAARGKEIYFDTENLYSINGPMCFVCEEPWTVDLDAKPCPGEPRSRGRA